ncbi:MAG: glycerophosphodiester phosphodiesterase [Actinomycetota bacterium]
MTKVIAHRGASAAFRENTVEAFAGARAMGADMVELDVRRTADGTLAVHHDAVLPDGPALVNLSAADLPEWVPTLAQALDACEPLGVNIEIKNYPGDPDYDETLALAEAVTAFATEQRLHDRVLISSFNLNDVDRVRAIDPAIPTAWLTMSISDPATTVDRCVRHGHRVLHPLFALVDDELLAACRAEGVAVNTWTVDDPGVMRRLVDQGVDGIVTNVPDVLISLLGRDAAARG